MLLEQHKSYDPFSFFHSEILDGKWLFLQVKECYIFAILMQLFLLVHLSQMLSYCDHPESIMHCPIKMQPIFT